MEPFDKERLVSECVRNVPGFVFAPVEEMLASPSFGWEFASYLATSKNIDRYLKGPKWKWIKAAIKVINHPTCFPIARRNSIVGAVREAAALYQVKESREVLNALLITKCATFGTIAWEVRKSARVIEAYHELFFNVGDRAYDKNFIDGLFENGGFRLVRPATSEFPDGAELSLLAFGRTATIGDVCHARTNSVLLPWRRGAEKRCKDMLKETRAEKTLPLGDRIALLTQRMFLQSQEMMWAEILRPR